MSVRTADRVREVATELGYRESSAYRQITTGPHHRIGLTIADVSNPFYFDILRGAEAQASKLNNSMLLMYAQESAAKERANLNRLLPIIDGLIVASSQLSDTVLRSLSKTLPVVVLNRYIGGLPSVTPDTSHGMRQAITHLLTLGHSSVHYLAGPESSWISGMRWLAVRTAAASMGFTAHRIGPVAPTVEGGASAVSLITNRRASAVICFNDLIAMGLMKALITSGYSVPNDISLIGCDNVLPSDLVTPGLTTIAAPTSVLGDTAVKHIIAMLDGTKPQLTTPITIPVRLVVRGSTGACPKHRI